MLDSNLIDRIRAIFLHQRPHVSIAEAAVLLGWSRGEMSRAIATGEIEVETTPDDRWIWREELMAKALELWTLETIEHALGADAAHALPDAVRLIDLHVRLPRHQVTMLAYFAQRDSTTVSSVLAQELNDVASAHAGELSSVIAGFAEAIAWPDAETAQLPA